MSRVGEAAAAEILLEPENRVLDSGTPAEVAPPDGQQQPHAATPTAASGTESSGESEAEGDVSVQFRRKLSLDDMERLEAGIKKALQAEGISEEEKAKMEELLRRGAAAKACALEAQAEDMATKEAAPCAVCKEMIGEREVRSTLACGHVVHQLCWRRHNKQYVDRMIAHAQAKLRPENNEVSDALRCPICHAWHGPNGCDGMPTMTISNEDKTGHYEWRPPSGWFQQPVSDLIHQVLGYIYQRHCIDHCGREGSVEEERAWISRCRNRASKAKGGQQLLESLDKKCKVLSSMSIKKGGALVPPKVVVSVASEVVIAIMLHCVEMKKGKVLDKKQAAEWIRYMRPWLVTAGLTLDMIEEVDKTLENNALAGGLCLPPAPSSSQ
mmetsp:Transcript_4326/g.9816  ORF Transcript_4326/g.9816 Transcript_4326/m.9816 type:complete len:383 (-) Transcript_4326:229-1377(-)